MAFVGVLAQVILWSISEPADLFSDFFKAYYPAADRLLNEGAVVTWETEESAAVGFVNLPILAWLFVPLALLGEAAAGWVFLACGIVALAVTYRLMLRLGVFSVAAAAMLALSILANGPLVNGLREGNTTHFVLLLLVVALLLWRSGADYAAGALLGLCALIKLPLLLFGLYALLRGQWRMAAGGATVIGGAALLSLAVFGLEINIGWYRNCIEPFIGGVMPAFNVQSIDGFLARLATGPELLMEWTPLAAPLWHRLVRSAILLTLFSVAAVAIMRSGSRQAGDGASSERRTLEFSIVLVLAVVTSPLSWSHYYLLLLLPWALFLGGELDLPDDAPTRWLMAGGMALASMPVIILPLESGLMAAIGSRTLVSAWLFGGLLMLTALIRGALSTRAHVREMRRPATVP
ncbi:MAG TPA: glycosyltransferase family 87 protein [Hyphomicrobiaceae bacterium]|nr:glycosyltransferase family 87 protein [Hyphomicrobiaceae bacterium]